MVTLEQAYEMIKEKTEYPMGYLLETEDAFWGATVEGYCSVNKVTGELELIQRYGDYLHRLEKEKYVYLEQLFTDNEMYFQNHPENKDVAFFYAFVWNRLFYQRKAKAEDYRNEGERQKLISRWNALEQELYALILERMSDGDYDRPPCVTNKADDPFYKIKPYMLKYGFTDNANDRTWVAIDKR